MSAVRTCRTLITVALLALTVACGGGEPDAASGGEPRAAAENSASGVAEKQLEVMRDMTTILEDVTDVDSLEAAKPKMAALGERLQGYMKQWEDNIPSIMARPGGAQEMAAHAQNLGKVQQELTAQMMRIAQDPALSERFGELSDAMGDAMKSGR